MSQTTTTRRLGAAVLLAAIAACGGDKEGTTDSAAGAAVPGATAAAVPPAGMTIGAAPEAGASASAVAAGAQGAQGALLDPNSATKEQIVATGVPGHAADAIVAGRPYADNLALNKALSTHLDSAARVGVYQKVWKPIDLNTAKGDEILLIPGVGRRMRHEFEEYRPYKNIEQFRREIGKYVNKDEVARLERYVMIKP